MDRKYIQVIDNFFPDWEFVKSLVDEAEFGDTTYAGEVYHGFCPIQLPARALLQSYLKTDVQILLNHLRIGTRDHELTHFIHSDNAGSQYAAVIYLTTPECDTGTAFWTHKEKGLDRLKLPVDMKLYKELDSDIEFEERWDRTGYVTALENRCLLFDCSLFHSRYPKHLTEIGPDDTPRIVATIFFNTSDTL